MPVVMPTRLLNSERPSIRPSDRSTSNTEKGRRNSGSLPRPDFTMTN